MDTSSLISGEKYFPQESNRELWQKLHALTIQRRMAMPPQAFDEISRSNKPLYSWASKRRTSLVVPANKEIFGLAGEVTRKFPGLVDAGKIRPDADPYVISLARWFDKKNRPRFDTRQSLSRKKPTGPTRSPTPHHTTEYRLPTSRACSGKRAGGPSSRRARAGKRIRRAEPQRSSL